MRKQARAVGACLLLARVHHQQGTSVRSRKCPLFFRRSAIPVDALLLSQIPRNPLPLEKNRVLRKQTLYMLLFFENRPLQVGPNLLILLGQRRRRFCRNQARAQHPRLSK